MALSVVKIAEYTRGVSPDGYTHILLVDSRARMFVGYSQSGESGTEYDVELQLDLANKTATENILHTKTDGICYGGLKIFGKNITTRRFGAYGEVGGHCPYEGHLMDLDDPDNYLCTCDGASNCNLTSNLGGLLYDPVSGKILVNGECGGRWIWIIDPSDLTIVGRVTESAIRSLNHCSIGIVPRDDEKVFVVAGKGNLTGSKYIRIGLVDIEDIIDNASSNPNVDDLGSWEELLVSTSYYRHCFIQPISNGSKILMRLHDGTTGNLRTIYDPVNNTLTPLDTIPRTPLTFGKWYGIDAGNVKHIIYDDDGATQLQTITDTDTWNKAGISFWFSTLTDTSTQKVIIKGLSLDGTTIPWIEWDFENNKFRVIDFITGNPITMDVYIMWSRLQSSVSQFGTLPYIANNRMQKITVDDWTPIPNLPTANVRVLYVVPDFASALQQ